MSVKLSIKLDSAKIRIYLDGNVNTITHYLENKSYAAIHTVMSNELTKIKEAKLVLESLKEEAEFQSTTIKVLELAKDGPVVNALVDEFSANFAEREKVAQVASRDSLSYSVPEYNLAYNATESLRIEFWLPI